MTTVEQADNLPTGTAAGDLPLAAVSAEQAETNAGVARATGVVALGNIASRVLGLAREIVLTNLFGASGAVDALNVAIIIPKAVYDLLIGGHINSALVPVLSEVSTRDGQKALWQLVSVLMSLVTVILAALVLIIEIFAPQIVGFIGSGFDDSTVVLATDLLRLTAPALMFLSLFAVLSGTLYALRSFTWPAFAGAVFNGSIVISTLLLVPGQQITPILNGSQVEWTLARPSNAITAAALGWLIGALVQFILQLPGLRDSRLHFSIQWNHPAVRRITHLYAPVMFSLVLDTLVIRTFSFNLASKTGEGSIGYMAWATTLIQFPQGLVATAISIAILPTLSRQAVLIANEGSKAFKDTLGLGLRLAITLILPAAIGLFVLATPIIALIFEHGAFNTADTSVTSLALRLYLIGLPFAAIDLLLVYAFYARQDTLTPALIGALSLTVYMITALVLLPRYGLFSLMIADSMKHITHALISAYLLTRRVDGFGQQRLTITTLKTGVAALVMGAGGMVLLPVLLTHINQQHIGGEVLLVGLAGSVSLGIFVVMTAVLRLEELYWLGGLVKRRLFD